MNVRVVPRLASLLVILIVIQLAQCSATSTQHESVETSAGALSFTNDPLRLAGDRLAVGGSASRMLLARVTDDGGVQARFYTGSWSNWRDLGSPQITSGVTIVQQGTSYTIYGRSPVGVAAITYDDGVGAWGGWYSLGSPGVGVSSAPTAVTWPSGWTTVFVRGGDGSLQAVNRDPVYGWGAWYSLGGNLASAPAAWINGSYLTVAAKAAVGGRFALITFNGSSWGGWYGVSSPAELGSAVVPVVNGSRTFLFARGTDSTLQVATFAGSTWVGSSLGGTVSSMPAAIAAGTTTSAYVRGTNGILQAITFDGTWWGGWYSISQWSGLSLTTPPAAYVSGATIRIFGTDSVGATWQHHNVGGPQSWALVMDGTTDAVTGAISTPLKNPGMGWILEEYGPLTGDGSHPDPVYYNEFACREADWDLVDTVEVMDNWSYIQRGGPTSFDFGRLRNMIDFWRGKGKRISLRVSTEDVGCWSKYALATPNREGCAGPPAWLWSSVSKYVLPQDEITWEFPDYTDPDYQAAVSAFVTELGLEFNGNARGNGARNASIDMVILRGYGKWGEWHSGASFASEYDRRTVLGGIINQWSNAFPDKILPMSVSWEYQTSNPSWNIDTLNLAFAPPSPDDGLGCRSSSRMTAA